MVATEDERGGRTPASSAAAIAPEPPQSASSPRNASSMPKSNAMSASLSSAASAIASADGQRVVQPPPLHIANRDAEVASDNRAAAHDNGATASAAEPALTQAEAPPKTPGSGTSGGSGASNAEAAEKGASSSASGTSNAAPADFQSPLPPLPLPLPSPLPVDPALSDTTPLLPAPQPASRARVVDPLTLHGLIVAALRAQETGDAAAVTSVQARLQAALEGRPPPPPPPTLGATFGLFGIGGSGASIGAGIGIGAPSSGFGFAAGTGLGFGNAFGVGAGVAAGAGMSTGRQAFGGAVPLPFGLSLSPTAAAAKTSSALPPLPPSPEEAVAALLPAHKGEPVAVLVRELLSEERDHSRRLNQQLLQAMQK